MVPYPLFGIYRLLVATYAVAITVVTILMHPSNLMPWPVWLTNWSFLLLTCHLLCASINVLLEPCFKRQRSTHLLATSIPCPVKMSYFLFSVAAPAAIIVTVVYFAGVFPRRHRNYLNFEDVNCHVMNTVIIILEFTIAAFPVRLLHAVYVWCYALAYVIFSVIYWAFDHSHVMYPGVLDWNAPGTTAVVIVIMGFVAIPLLQFILFGIYQLRMFVHAQCAFRQLQQ